MRWFPVNLQELKAVWENIESIDDPRLTVQKEVVRPLVEEICRKSDAEWSVFWINIREKDEPSSETAPAACSADQVFASYIDMARTLIKFVSAAMDFYRELSSHRPLSTREKQIGQLLLPILQAADHTSWPSLGPLQDIAPNQNSV